MKTLGQIELLLPPWFRYLRAGEYIKPDDYDATLRIARGKVVVEWRRVGPKRAPILNKHAFMRSGRQGFIRDLRKDVPRWAELNRSVVVRVSGGCDALFVPRGWHLVNKTVTTMKPGDLKCPTVVDRPDQMTWRRTVGDESFHPQVFYIRKAPAK